MEQLTTEGAITGLAWTVICVAATAYLPFWHLLISVLISVNTLVVGLIIYTLFKWPTFNHAQILFDTVWSPFVSVLNYSKMHLTEPNLQGKSKLLPISKRMPAWGRRQAFIVSAIALNSGTSTDICLYISWVIYFNSLFFMLREIFGPVDVKDTICIYNFENEITFEPIFLSQSFEDVAFNTHLYFWALHSTICLLCIVYNCLSMTIIDICIAVLFACCSHSQIQLQVMAKFKQAFPYVLDGLGELAVLCIFLLMDIMMSGSLFFSAYNMNRSLLLVCVTYCNTFAAVMEFHVRVWLPLRNERFLITRMRWATKEEIITHNDVCAICLALMTSARVTVCQHMFHGKCLRLSLKNSAQCPLCKSALVPARGHSHLLL